jgi:carboxyl-terminal processing protease
LPYLNDFDRSETMRCGLRAFAAVGILLSALLAVPASDTLCADRAAATAGVDKREAYARRVWAIVDLVLAHHVDPPTRQDMILGGIKASLAEFNSGPHPDLGRRVSEIKTARDLCAILNDIGPAANESDGAALKQASDQVEKTFLRGLLNAVPGNPGLVSENEARAEAQLQANRYVGVGITVSAGRGRLPLVEEVVPDAPADSAGVRAGDVIEEIDHVAVVPGSFAGETVDRVRGAEGTQVTLRLRSEDSSQLRTVTLTRRRIVIRTVEEESANGSQEFPREPAMRVNATPCINHVRITKISASTAHELRVLEAKLRRVGTQAVILDLRGTSTAGYGIGSDHLALLLADCLLDRVPLGKLQTHHGMREFTAGRDCVFRDWPLAILIDENTRGAAEWVAAALQDADPPTRRFGRRAIIVGMPSAGENLVRSAVRLPNREEFVMLATGAWQRPRPNRQRSEPALSPAGALLVQGISATEHGWRVIPDLVVDPQTGITNATVETLWGNRRNGPSATGAVSKISTQQRASDAVVVMRDPLRVAVAVLELQWKAAPEVAK